jgi:hypothetical protein
METTVIDIFFTWYTFRNHGLQRLHIWIWISMPLEYLASWNPLRTHTHKNGKLEELPLAVTPPSPTAGLVCTTHENFEPALAISWSGANYSQEHWFVTAICGVGT